MNTETGKIRKFVKLDVENLPEVVPGAVYFMHGDPGVVNDAFALSVVHTVPGLTKEITLDDKNKETLRHTVVDFVLSWKPRPQKQVDLLNQEAIMMMLVERYNIKKVNFDRWNSAGSIQKLQDMQVDASDMSFSSGMQLDMYKHLRLLIYNRMLTLPPDHIELLNKSGDFSNSLQPNNP